jgi:urocanate hydratase
MMCTVAQTPWAATGSLIQAGNQPSSLGLQHLRSTKMADQNIPETAEVFDHYTALMSVAPEPGGSLVFYGELNTSGMATAVATNIAGAASLGVDTDPGRIKQGLRQGLCDFMVNSLDEALRILKNQIRKKEPVAVVLVGDPERVAGEMLERGVQPDLVSCGAPHEQAFTECGAMVLPAAAAMADSLVVAWSVSRDPALWLPRVDGMAMEALEETSDARMNWIRLAPRYLQKSLSRERYVRMRADELVRFVGLLQQRVQSGEISVPIQVSSDGLPVVQSAPADSSAAV